jgi:hypothetical protein
MLAILFCLRTKRRMARTVQTNREITRTRCLIAWSGLIVPLYALLSCAVVAVAQGHHSDDRDPNANRVVKEATVDAKALVNALENHNPRPAIGRPRQNAPDFGVPIFDQKYDWHEYTRVNKAIDVLAGSAEAAWPELLRHFDDERYCMTYHNDVAGNYSLGSVCQLIVRGWLFEGFGRHIGPWFDSHAINSSKSELAYARLWAPQMLRGEGRLKAWCESRRGKRLYELQIEMCEWAISRVTELKELSDKEREPFVKAVRAEIVELGKSKKAARFHGFGGNEDYELYTPESADKIRRRQRGQDPHSHKMLPPGSSALCFGVMDQRFLTTDERHKFPTEDGRKLTEEPQGAGRLTPDGARRRMILRQDGYGPGEIWGQSAFSQ